MKRRELLVAASAALGLSAIPFHWVPAAEPRKKKVLYFTRSAGFVHSVVGRKGDQLSHSEKVLTEMGARAGFDVDCTQDGTVFDGNLDRYDAIAFYTSGDLCSSKGNGKPMTPAGKQKLLEAIAAGKGFVGFHACTDSFRGKPEIDPYIAMVGAEFIAHDAQQKATLRVVSDFPGLEEFRAAKSVAFMEEWYAQHKFAKDLHVTLVQETKDMKGPHYERPDFPCTWARMHQKGRVFYTSLGHREDVWTSPLFQNIVLGGFAWVFGNVQADVTPNIDKVTPGANQLKR